MSKTPLPQMTLESTLFTMAQLRDMPQAPQVALAGRSNVGKSSLVNTMAGRKKGLAKISATPGKTRSLNFYKVDTGGLYLVDLPGYGYARCSKTERDQWAKLIDRYLKDAGPLLLGVAVLLDCRHEPQRLDIELTAYLRRMGQTVFPVLTKADKCKQNDRAARIKDWKALLPGSDPLLFSSKTGLGREALWQRLLGAANLLPAEPAKTTPASDPGSTPTVPDQAHQGHDAE